MSDPETHPDVVQSRRSRDRLARFDPTVTMGALLQMALIVAACVAAYGTYSADRAKQAMEVVQIKADATEQRAQMKEQMTDLRLDVKEVQKSLSTIDKSLVELKAQQQPRRMP